MNQEEIYYQKASEGSADLNTPVMKELLQFSRDRRKILDLGCGEGTRLTLIAKNKNGVGIDINEFAIKRAKKCYPQLKFIRGDIEKLPCESGSFDMVYSAFVLEHLENTEKVLKEAVRVLLKGGLLFLAAPNYGAPNRRSPCFVGNKYLKLVKGIINDFILLFGEAKSINWDRVKPRTDESYQIDFDVQKEPYIFSLIKYLKNLNLKIIKWSSLWQLPEDNITIPFKIIKFLGRMDIFPFRFWGPQLLVVAEKE